MAPELETAAGTRRCPQEGTRTSAARADGAVRLVHVAEPDRPCGGAVTPREFTIWLRLLVEDEQWAAVERLLSNQLQ